MKNIDIIIRESGLLEALSCTVEDIKASYMLWRSGFSYGECYVFEHFGIFQEMMFGMSSLKSANEIFKKHAEFSKEYAENIEEMKRAGTYEEWLKRISAENKRWEPIMKEFFDRFSKAMPPLKKPGHLN